jgi:hypothetical protein
MLVILFLHCRSFPNGCKGAGFPGESTSSKSEKRFTGKPARVKESTLNWLYLDRAALVPSATTSASASTTPIYGGTTAIGLRAVIV